MPSLRDGEICAIRMFGPSHCFQRSQFASSAVRVRRLLQSLAPAPLVGPGSSMRRGEALPSASMPKDRRGTCAWRVTPHLPRCCMTSFCAPQPVFCGAFGQARPTGARTWQSASIAEEGRADSTRRPESRTRARLANLGRASPSVRSGLNIRQGHPLHTTAELSAPPDVAHLPTEPGIGDRYDRS